MHVLASLDLGRRPGYVVIRDADVAGSFPQAAATWIDAAPAQARERRQQVAAAALLFLAFRALDAGDGPGVKSLIEEECARMRRGQLAEFERRWLLASLALVEWSGDRRFLTGPCDSAQRAPCDHLSHVRTVLPGESLVQLVELTQPGGQPGYLSRLMVEALLRPGDPSSLRVPAVARLESGLSALLTDPVVGTDARLRLGLLKYGIHERRQSLDELARVTERSVHPAERVTAHFYSALIHDAESRPADALRSLENALAVMPHVRSIALMVATRHYLAGRVDDAATLLDATLAADPPELDPPRERHRERHAIWTWYQAFDRLVELYR
jgi:hypothetical protein